ncbi:MAG: biotin--acetyl-CoA-carboxylase ligase [Desulfovibrionaceae bacterium]|nr:biotin--acetyl-CoA-carboxylase ligase [Desulfovibrionaceae bacterium]
MITKTPGPAKLLLLSSGLDRLAAPLNPGEAAELEGLPDDMDSFDPDNPKPADIIVCGRVSSTFDLAWRLHELQTLPDWGAILALTQEAGRGQLRRPWHSPAGNLHVSFRLPEKTIFSGPSASVILALLLLEAFAELGLSLKIKWPNDLVLKNGGGYGKLGGILLEERGGVMLAGLGINCRHLPPPGMLREDASLPPARLPEGFAWKTPLRLWSKLAENIKTVYKGFLNSPPADLPGRAEARLLWLRRDIRLTDGERSISGEFIGLSPRGGLILRPHGAYERGAREFTSGGIALLQ